MVAVLQPAHDRMYIYGNWGQRIINNTICFTCVCVLLMQPNPDQIDLEHIDELPLNLSTAVPTVEVTNTVASGRDTPAVTVAILRILQTLLPSNLSG